MSAAPKNILRIDSSMRVDGSVTRQLTGEVIDALIAQGAEHVVTRDLANGIDLIDADWIGSNFTARDERNADQLTKLTGSDALVAELQAADVIVIGAPIYNFSVPGALKAWIDLIARVGVTFEYTPDGPKGLLLDKKAIIVVGSGGTPKGAAYDFATDYLVHVLGFLGISDVRFVDATGLMGDASARIVEAQQSISSAAA